MNFDTRGPLPAKIIVRPLCSCDKKGIIRGRERGLNGGLGGGATGYLFFIWTLKIGGGKEEDV